MVRRARVLLLLPLHVELSKLLFSCEPNPLCLLAALVDPDRLAVVVAAAAAAAAVCDEVMYCPTSNDCRGLQHQKLTAAAAAVAAVGHSVCCPSDATVEEEKTKKE
jgi:hypothetical protein